MEKIVIVDENDNQIGVKNRDEVKTEDIYRVAALMIENSNNEILLSKRSLQKKSSPGRWGSSAGGTLEEGETYDLNIRKEVKEEIGLEVHSLEKREKLRRGGNFNFFIQWYYLKLDKDINEFKLQEEEVEEVRWFDKKKLKKEFKANPKKFSGTMEMAVRLFC